MHKKQVNIKQQDQTMIIVHFKKTTRTYKYLCFRHFLSKYQCLAMNKTEYNLLEGNHTKIFEIEEIFCV